MQPVGSVNDLAYGATLAANHRMGPGSLDPAARDPARRQGIQKVNRPLERDDFRFAHFASEPRVRSL